MFTDGLRSIFVNDTVPVLNVSRCLNRRNRFEPCSLCVDACRSNAVNITSAGLLIDEAKCNSCGLCAVNCPSQAITLKDYQIFRSISGSEDLKCFKYGGVYCLGALSAEFWACVFLVKPEVIISMPCDQCELKCSNNNNIDEALKFLSALKVNASPEIIHDPDTEREISRRELMASFFMWGKQKGSNIIEDVLWHNKAGMLEARKFLSDRLSDSSGEIDSGIFHDFDVSAECDACGVCLGVCPSGSWSITKHEGTAELNYSINECSGCMLCVKMCPQKAIKTKQKFTWPVKSELKKKFDMLRCKHCGSWFIMNDTESELCSKCSRRS